MIKKIYRNIGLKFFLLSCICFCSLSVYAQWGQASEIKGMVKSDGIPLQAITVSVENEFKQTSTDLDGHFAISTEVGKFLVFSGKGYQMTRVKVEDPTALIQVDMKRESEYEYFYGYTSRKKTMTTAAISVAESSVLSRTPVATINDAIQGAVSGLTVEKASGSEPGWSLSNYYIRGLGSFGNVTPLILVDNVERDITLLEPDEIESFSVLKDAAATVKYGLRGANGVISIKTKRGYVGKPEVSLKANFGLQSAARLPEYLGSQEYVRFRNIALKNDGLGIPTDPRYNPDMYNGTQDPYLYSNTDWYDEFIKSSSPMQNYRLSVTGGTDAVKYYVLMGVTNQMGLYKHTSENPAYKTNPSYTRYNVRSNVDLNLSKYLTVSLDLGAKIETKRFPTASASDIMKALTSLPPTIPMLNRDGTIAGTSSFTTNPYGLLSRNGYNDDNNRYLQGNVSADYKLDFWLKGLSANILYGFDAYKKFRRGKTQSYAVYQQNLDGTYSVFGQDSDIDGAINASGTGYDFRSTVLGGLSYNSTFNDTHAVIVDLKYRQSGYWEQNEGPDYKEQDYLGSVTYGYDNRYIAEFAFSYSGSENFRKGKRFKFFPVGSLAWVISNEGFFKDIKAINYLKLRSSYGLVGNSKMGLSRFTYEANYYQGNGYIFGDGYAWSDGAYEGQIANANIVGEESKNLNIGVDAELWKGKLNFTFDVFRNDRSKIITTRSETLPTIIGQKLPYENIGSVLNKGFEFTVSHNNRVGDISYFVQANVSFARNKITYMDEVAGLDSWLYQTGKPIGVARGLQAVGFFSSQEEIDGWAKSTYGTVTLGDVKYVDQNHDNIIDENDYIPFDYSHIPEWNFGLNLGASYKNFDLNLLLAGVANRTLFISNNVMVGMLGENKVSSTAYDSWQQGVNESTAKFPRLTTEINNHNMQNSSVWKHNGNYLKLQNIEIGYNLPKSAISRLRLKELRFFVNGYNLFSFDHLKKYNLSADYPNAGVTAYPDMKIYNIGVNVKF